MSDRPENEFFKYSKVTLILLQHSIFGTSLEGEVSIV